MGIGATGVVAEAGFGAKGVDEGAAEAGAGGFGMEGPTGGATGAPIWTAEGGRGGGTGGPVIAEPGGLGMPGTDGGRGIVGADANGGVETGAEGGGGTAARIGAGIETVAGVEGRATRGGAGTGFGGRLIIAVSRGLEATGVPSLRAGRTMRTVSFFGSAIIC